jgi:S1-C subfamily serine protease
MAEIHAVWTCPSCARRVPNRVIECRCGFRHADAPPPLPEASESVTKTGRRGVAFLAAGVLVCAVVALLAMPSSRPAPVPGPAPAPTAVANGALPEGVASAPLVAPMVGAITDRRESETVAPDTTVPPGSLEDVVQHVVPAVVSIHAGGSRGSGFYFKPGLVLTNVHVIEGYSTVDVKAGETSRTARVMSMSRGADLAVLQVYSPDPNQKLLPLGTARSLRVGQEVIAVGSALGVLPNTVTRGIVSAVRQAGDLVLIQTDAAINPGNSGGPLINRSGEVIGVNTLKIARVAESLGFAVAIDHVGALLNGQSSMATAASPASGLHDMLQGGARPEGERLRDEGEQGYTAVLEAASRSADQIDNYWNQYSKTCVSSVRGQYDRPWFGVFTPNGVAINVHSAYDCERFLDSVRTNAERLKTEVEKGSEAARRKGVYPGVIRDMRRKHRLDWER